MTVAVHAGYGNWYSVNGNNHGIEHDLLKLFAQHTGKNLNFKLVNTASDAFTALEENEASLAVGSLVLPESKKNLLSAGPTYMTVKQTIVHHYTETPPASPAEISMNKIHVGGNPAHLETLTKIRRQNDDPRLWILDKQTSAENLLDMINQGFINYAVVNSDKILLLKQYYPNIKEAFSISDELPITWIFHINDQPLSAEINRFFTEIKHTRELNNILDRHYGHTQHLNYPQKLTLIKNYDQHFIKYRDIFQELGNAYDIDWKLLAAISYQESHWNPKAQSVSGVKGLMMVTKEVLNKFQLPDRYDPVQNALAGTKYLLQLKDQLPPEIGEPDRTWLGLIAYNIGFSNLQKIIDQVQEQNQKRVLWVDVRDTLRTTKRPSNITAEHAHTYNPINYVYNIRAYYDLITWLDSGLSR